MEEKTFTCAVIIKNEEQDNYVVDNLIVFTNLSAIQAVKEAMGYDYLLPVTDAVQIGDIYDAEKDIYTRDGVRVYPDMSNEERITALEQAQDDTDMALIEIVSLLDGTAAEE